METCARWGQRTSLTAPGCLSPSSFCSAPGESQASLFIHLQRKEPKRARLRQTNSTTGGSKAQQAPVAFAQTPVFSCPRPDLPYRLLAGLGYTITGAPQLIHGKGGMTRCVFAGRSSWPGRPRELGPRRSARYTILQLDEPSPALVTPTPGHRTEEGLAVLVPCPAGRSPVVVDMTFRLYRTLGQPLLAAYPTLSRDPYDQAVPTKQACLRRSGQS